MTIADLANDSTFEPDDYRHHVGRPAEAMHCRVAGCLARHVPASTTERFGRVGVCGYCRAKVKAAHAAAPNVPTPG